MKKQAVFVILLLCLPLFFLEGAARLIFTMEQDWRRLAASRRLEEVNAWRVYSADLGWEKRVGFRGFVGPVYRELDGTAEDLLTGARRTTLSSQKTVLFLGDSNTFGWGVAKADSFVAVSERLLPDIKAINLGVPGYTSYQGMLLVEKYLPVLSPDVMVELGSFFCC
jgi:hypothetical protein